MATLDLFGLRSRGAVGRRPAAGQLQRRWGAACGAALAALFSLGCTLIADVDRSKIPEPATEFVDAGSQNPPPNMNQEPTPLPDAGPGPEAGPADAAVSDAAAGDAAADSGADAAATDAGNDGG